LAAAVTVKHMNLFSDQPVMRRMQQVAGHAQSDTETQHFSLYIFQKLKLVRPLGRNSSDTAAAETKLQMKF